MSCQFFQAHDSQSLSQCTLFFPLSKGDLELRWRHLTLDTDLGFLFFLFSFPFLNSLSFLWLFCSKRGAGRVRDCDPGAPKWSWWQVSNHRALQKEKTELGRGERQCHGPLGLVKCPLQDNSFRTKLSPQPHGGCGIYRTSIHCDNTWSCQRG